MARTPTKPSSNEEQLVFPTRRKLTREEKAALPPGPRPKGFRERLAEYIWPNSTAIRKAQESFHYGDVATFRVGPHLVFQINSPELIREAFIDNYDHLQRGQLEAVRWMLGNGLLMSNPPEHTEHRRLLRSEFDRHRVTMYCAPMVESAVNHIGAWEDGQRVEFLNSMSMLGTDMTAKTLFGVDITDKTERMGHGFEALLRYLFTRQTQHPKWMKIAHKLPFPSSRAFRRNLGELNQLVYDMINTTRRTQRIHDDFISVVVQQQQRGDEEFDIYDLMVADAAGQDAAPAAAAAEEGGCPVAHSWWTDKQVRDEAVTFLLAGQESYHIAMTWVMHYLAENPQLQEQLHKEVDETIGDNPVDFADFPQLTFIDQLILEGLRIFAPLGLIGRVASQDITIGGHLVPQGSAVIVPIVLFHRNPKYFPDPDDFIPGRWTPEFQRGLPRFAYIPFGVGYHRCIGEQFAWMQMRVTLATIAQQWWVRPDPTHPIEVDTHFTVAPKGGMPLYVERRKK